MVLLSYLIVTAAAAVAAFRVPAVAFAAVLCMFGIEQIAQSASVFYVQYRSLVNLTIGGLVLVAYLGRVHQGRGLLPRYDAVGWLALSLYGYALVSLIWTPDPASAWTQWATHWPYIVTLVLLMPPLLDDVRELERGVQVLLLVGMSVIALVLLTGQWTGRALALQGLQTAEGGNPLAMAQMAGYVAIAAVLLNFSGVGRVWQVLRWAIMAACLVVVVKSASRGQFGALLLSILLFLPFARTGAAGWRVLVVAWAVGVGGALAYWALGTYSVELEGRWSGEAIELATGGRLQSAATLLEAWSRSGASIVIGLGNSAAFALLGIYPHNVPVEILAEEGLAGLGLFSAIVILAGRAFFRLTRKVAGDRRGGGAVSVLGALSVFEFLLLLKQGSLLGNPLFFALVASLYRIERLKGAPTVHADEPPVPLAARDLRSEESRVRDEGGRPGATESPFS